MENCLKLSEVVAGARGEVRHLGGGDGFRRSSKNAEAAIASVAVITEAQI